MGIRLMREFLASRQSAPGRDSDPIPKTARQLLEAAEQRYKAWKRDEEERAKAEKARQEAEAAALRARRLEALSGREEELWRNAEQLIETKKAKGYGEALRLLIDLRDLAVRDHAVSSFHSRLAELTKRPEKSSRSI